MKELDEADWEGLKVMREKGDRAVILPYMPIYGTYPKIYVVT